MKNRNIKENAPHRPSILLAHSEPEEANFLVRFLHLSGYHVTLCYDGHEALLRVAERDYDLVVTAVILPGVDGLELVRVINERLPGLPVIVLSKSHLEIDRIYLRHAELFGAAATFTQPFAPSELLHGIRAVLSRKVAAARA